MEKYLLHIHQILMLQFVFLKYLLNIYPYPYYHLMTKALAAADVKTLELPNGKKVDWASDLALKMINAQNGDGSWVNDTARWMEKDPVLVTTYCVLSLEIIFQRL